MQVPCTQCRIEIEEGEYVITTYQPEAEPPLPKFPPLHAKKCARALFDDNLVQFVDAMLLEGLPSDKVVTAEELDFEF